MIQDESLDAKKTAAGAMSSTLRRDQEAMIRERLVRAKKEGDLPASANPAHLARYLTTVMQGMSVLANGGATRSELRKVADTALGAWPR